MGKGPIVPKPSPRRWKRWRTSLWDYRVNILISRICFRGIYFPQLGRFAWVKTIFQNRRTIFGAVREGLGLRRAARAEASLRLSSSAQR